MKKLYGTGVALVTPFDRNKKIDFKALSRLLNSTAEKGSDYYVVLGTTGESATLSLEERSSILEYVKKHNSAQLPIVLGHGGNNTAEVIAELAAFDLTGVDALLSISPYYNKPSQEGIYQHYLALANASPVPILLYNVPGRTSSNIHASTTARLSSHGNIIGIKEASGDVAQAMKIRRDSEPGFMLISGDDLWTLPLLSIGGVGVISVLANAYADIFAEIHRATGRGAWTDAAKLAYKLLEINPLMYEEANPVGIKVVLEYQKICEAFVRLPLYKASGNLKKRIKKAHDSLY